MTVVVPAIAVADPHCGVDELVLLVVIASHGDVGASGAELADRLSWGRVRLRASRQILEELDYISVETRDRGELVFRVRTACGPSADGSTPSCADGLVQTRSLDDAASGGLNQTRSTDDDRELSTAGVDPKHRPSSDDAASPQDPQGSTTSTQTPPSTDAVVPPVEDVKDAAAPPTTAAQQESLSRVVNQALNLLADRERDHAVMLEGAVSKGLRARIYFRLKAERTDELTELAGRVEAASGEELLRAQTRERELEIARNLGEMWACLQRAVDVKVDASYVFRHAVDPPAAIKSCFDAYQAERSRGRLEWLEKAHAFGASFATRHRPFTAGEVEQRAVQRFGFDDELTEITLAAWRAADTRKASA